MLNFSGLSHGLQGKFWVTCSESQGNVSKWLLVSLVIMGPRQSMKLCEKCSKVKYTFGENTNVSAEQHLITFLLRFQARMRTENSLGIHEMLHCGAHFLQSVASRGATHVVLHVHESAICDQ